MNTELNTIKINNFFEIMSQEKKGVHSELSQIYRSGCWGCKRAREDPAEKYVCPKLEQHRAEYKKYVEKFN